MKHWPADKVERRKERKCCDCGKVDLVRSDNSSVRCRPCAGKRSGAKGIATIKARAMARETECEVCGTRHRNKRFCSKACKSKSAERVERTCAHCGEGFAVLASRLRGNASGRFCSRSCYERFLCQTDRVSGRGSRWRKIRQQALSAAPFCALCGTRKELQVHHIIPFRLTQDNSPGNLIPLCVKHHRMVETALVSTEKYGFDEIAQAAWVGMLKERQMATAAKLKEIAGAV